jgi:hypothetical protein
LFSSRVGGEVGSQRCRVAGGFVMVGTLLVIYFVGWVVVTFAAYAAGKRLNERQSAAVHPKIVSLAAGAVWPLLVVGLVELSSVMMLTKVPSKPRPSIGIYA